jgi:hypothetical protein
LRNVVELDTEWKKGNPDPQDIEEVEAFVDNSWTEYEERINADD